MADCIGQSQNCLSISSISLHLVVITVPPPVPVTTPAPASTLAPAAAPPTSASSAAPLDCDTASPGPFVFRRWANESVVYRNRLVEQLGAMEGFDGSLGFNLGRILDQNVALAKKPRQSCCERDPHVFFPP